MVDSDRPFAIVVDDDLLVMLHASDILTDAGFITIEASNGDDAMKLLDRQADGIVLLFTDVEMPGEIDGLGLARHVAEFRPEIEIVVASGHLVPRDGDLPPSATFIVKPFSAQIVLDHLQEKLSDDKKPKALKVK